MLNYYDRVVGGIAASLLSGMLLGALTSLAFNVGVFLGALAATAFMYDAMFRNPPLPPSDPRVAATAIVWHGLLLTLAIAVYM